MTKNSHELKLKKVGINTYKEAIIYMRHDCHICRAEGYEVHARVLVSLNGQNILATLNTIENGLLSQGEAGLSNYAWDLLGAKEGDHISLSHPIPLSSLSHVRSKIYGNELAPNQIYDIVADITKGFYSDIYISAFLTACAGGRLNNHEISSLTKTMVEVGDKLSWPNEMVVDKHCIGGLPGNRTTPIVVSIVAAFGMVMPKTSSRAITSPAGTADVMEVLAPVDLTLNQMRDVVEKESACLVWGGAVSLSPADDILIGVERALNLDSEGQLVASVLSKKIAAGSTHVLIDMPVGPSAKIRSHQSADILKSIFENTARDLNLNLEVHYSDGSQPVGNGIGPALEAQDVVDVLSNNNNAPTDLRQRAIDLASKIIEFSPNCEKGQGSSIAKEILSSGKAWEKFQNICAAQGGMREIPKARYSHVFEAQSSGTIRHFDNRYLAKLAKLAGAPTDKSAGIFLHVHLENLVEKGQPLFTLYAESKGELNYAKEASVQMPSLIEIETKE